MNSKYKLLLLVMLSLCSASAFAQMTVGGAQNFNAPFGIGIGSATAKQGFQVGVAQYFYGDLRLFSSSGENVSGFANVRAGDFGGSSNIGLILGTQLAGVHVDAVTLAGDGSMTLGGTSLYLNPLSLSGGSKLILGFKDPDGGTGPMTIEYKDDASPDLAIMGGKLGVAIADPVEAVDVNGSVKASGYMYAMQKMGVGMVPSGSSENFEVNGNIKNNGSIFTSGITATNFRVDTGCYEGCVWVGDLRLSPGHYYDGTAMVADVKSIGIDLPNNGNIIAFSDNVFVTDGNFGAKGTGGDIYSTGGTGLMYTINGKMAVGMVPASEKFEVAGGNIKASGNIYTGSNGNIYTGTGGRMGVGIVPTVSSEALEVAGNIKSNNNIYTGTNGNIWTGTSGRIAVGIVPTGSMEAFEVAGSMKMSGSAGNIYTIGSTGYIYTMSGKMGIGVSPTTSTEAMEIAGSMKMSGSAGNIYSIGSTGYIYTMSGKMGIGVSPTTSTEAMEIAGNIKMSGTGSIYTIGTTGNIYTMSGKMGVGVSPTTGSQALEVAGNIHLTGAIISDAGISSTTSNITTTTGNISTSSGKLGVGTTPGAGSEMAEISGNLKTSGTTGNIYTTGTTGYIYSTAGKLGLGITPSSSTEKAEVLGNIKVSGTTGDIYTVGTTGYIYTTAGKLGLGITPSSSTEKAEVLGNIKVSGTTGDIYTVGTTGYIYTTAGKLGLGITPSSSTEKAEVNGNLKASGTTGNIFTTGTTGYIYTTAGKMGVGVTPTSSTEVFEVAGNVKASGTTGNIFTAGTAGNIYTSGTTGYIYTTAGKMGVGVTPTGSTEKLEVLGNIKASGSGNITASGILTSASISTGNITSTGTITAAGLSTSTSNLSTTTGYIFTTSGKIGAGLTPIAGSEIFEAAGNMKASGTTGNIFTTGTTGYVYTTAGKMGVGVTPTSSTEKLEVLGNIKASGSGNITASGILTSASISTGNITSTGTITAAGLSTTSSNLSTTTGYIFTTGGKIGAGLTPIAGSEIFEAAGNMKASGTTGNIFTTGTTGYIYTTAGKMGVGVTPTGSTEKLEVLGNIKASGSGNITASGTVTAASITAGNITSTGTITAAGLSTGAADLSTTTGNIYTTGGKMGIGVTPISTSQALEVVGNIKGSGNITVNGNLTSTSSTAGFIFTQYGKIAAGLNATSSTERLEIANGNIKAGGTTNGNIYTTVAAGSIYTTGATGNIYTTSGKMGVGVVPGTSSEKLEVAGNVKATNVIADTVRALSLKLNGVPLVSSPFTTSGGKLNYTGSIKASDSLIAKGLVGGSLSFSGKDTRVGTGTGADTSYAYHSNYNVYLGYKAGYTMTGTAGPFDSQPRSVFMVNNQARNSNPLLFGYFASIDDHNSTSSSVTHPAQLGINTTNLMDSIALTVKGGIAITKEGSTISTLGIQKAVGQFSLWAEDGVVSPSYFIAHRCMWDNDNSDCPDTWGDYVFEDDYRLKSLSEVNEYVKTNKHLPGIPSAEEIKSGYEVHGMNKNFVVKIEELTLYAIQQDQHINEQKKEIELLKEQLSGYKNLAAEVEELKSLIKSKN